MRLIDLMVVILAVPATATAQTTTCSKDLMDDVICKTVAPRTTPRDPGECLITSRLEAMSSNCTLSEIRAAKIRDANTKAVGALIANGKCPEARDYALKAGDLDLAERAARFCVLTAAPAGN